MTTSSDMFEVLITGQQYTKIKQQNDSLIATNQKLRADIKQLEQKIYDLDNQMANHIEKVELRAKAKQLSIHALKIGNRVFELEEQLGLKQKKLNQLLRQSSQIYRESIHKTSSQDEMTLSTLLTRIKELQQQILNAHEERDGKINQLTEQQSKLIEQMKQKQNNLDQLQTQIIKKQEQWRNKQIYFQKQMHVKDQTYNQRGKEAENQICYLKQQLNQLKLTLEQQKAQHNRIIAQFQQKQQEIVGKDKQLTERERKVVQQTETFKRIQQKLKSRENQIETVSREQQTTREEIVQKILQIERKNNNLSQIEEQLKDKMQKINIQEQQISKSKLNLKQQIKIQQQDYQNKIRSLKTFDNLQSYEVEIQNLKSTIKQMEINYQKLKLQAEQKQRFASAAQQTLNNLSQNQRIQQVIINNFQSMILLYKAKLQKDYKSEIKQRLSFKKNQVIKGLQRLFEELLNKK